MFHIAFRVQDFSSPLLFRTERVRDDEGNTLHFKRIKDAQKWIARKGDWSREYVVNPSLELV